MHIGISMGLTRLGRGVGGGVNLLFSMALTVDDTKISSGPHSGYVLLVPSSVFEESAPFIYGTFGAGGAKNDGGDIRLYLADGVTPIPFDIRAFDKASRRCVIFTRMPTLDTSNKTVVIKWGDSSLSALPATDPNGRNAVYQDYKIVQAMNSASQFVDLTGAAQSGTATVTGSIALVSDDHPWGDVWTKVDNVSIALANTASLFNGQRNLTFEAIALPRPLGRLTTNSAAVIGSGESANRIQLGLRASEYTRFGVHDGTSSKTVNGNADSSVAGKPIYYTGVTDSTNLRQYRNGVQQTSTASALDADGVQNTTQNFIMGVFAENSANYLDGYFCEVRAKTSADTLGRHATTYNNYTTDFFSSASISVTGGSAPTPSAPRTTANIASAWPTTTLCSIPAIGGIDAPIHPSVVDTGAGGFSGYRYWMVFTPYPTTSGETYENPCIVCSNDKINWVEPAGISNPIRPLTGTATKYQSDPSLFFDGTTLHAFWRESSMAGADYFYERFWYSSSVNGSSWTTPVIVLTNNRKSTNVEKMLTSSVFKKGNTWYWYSINQTGAGILRTAASPTGPWVGNTSFTFTGLPVGEAIPWNVFIYPDGDGFVCFVQTWTGTGAKSGNVFLGYAGSDGKEFVFSTPSKITTASPFTNYRASGIRLDANTWGVWLTNWNTRKIHYMTVTD